MNQPGPLFLVAPRHSVVSSVQTRRLFPGFFLLFLLFAAGTEAGAQNFSATWALTSSANASVTGAVSAQAVVFGSGVSAPSYNASTGAGVSGMNSGSQSNNDYLEFVLSPATGCAMTVTGISSTNSVSAVGASNGARYQIQYSFASNFSSPQSVGSNVTPATSPAVTNRTVNLTVNPGQTLYVRLYAWGLNASGTQFQTKDFTILGTSCPSQASIAYGSASYCKYANTTATPTIGGAQGGSFSAAAGLVLNSSTGVVNVSASTAGTYTVSYTVSGGTGCPTLVATTTIKINDLPTAFVLTGPDGATGSFCTNGTPATFTLTGSQAGVTYTFVSINPGGNTPPGQSFQVAGVGGTLEFTQTPDGNWSYSVNGTDNTTGCTNTMTGVLSAVDGPKVTNEPPAAVSVCTGDGPTALTLNVSNANSLTWQVSADGGLTWLTVSNNSNYAVTKATNNSSTTLTISNYTSLMSGSIYRVLYGGPAACPMNYSKGTVLTVKKAPVITSQPVSKAVCYKGTLTLSVSATDAAGYLWYKNGTAIPGATGAVYTKAYNPATDAAAYKVVVTGSCGSVTSADAVVTTSTTTTWQGPPAGAPAGSGTAWDVDANWSCGVPTSGVDAVIPVNILDGYPTVKAGVNGAVRNLTLNGGGFGAYLTVQGQLSIYGTVVNSGGVFDASAGTIEFAGSGTQTLPAALFDGNNVKNLVISTNVNLAGALNLTGALWFGPVNNKTFATADYLTLKSGAGTTARVADLTNNGVNPGNQISGNVTVERYLPSYRRYRLVTAPVQGASINAAWQQGRTWNGQGTEPGQYGTLITGSGQGSAATANSNGFDFWSATSNASVFRYSGSLTISSNLGASWVGLTNTKQPNFDGNEAYLLFVRGDRTVTGGVGATTLTGKGPLKEAVTQAVTVKSQSHVLVGNPYASPLNFQKLYTDNSSLIEPYYWTWQASLGSATGGYVLVQPNGSGGYEAVPSSGAPGSVEPVISSGEGFFVVPKTSATLPATLLIKQTQKTNGQPIMSVFRDAGAGPAKLNFSLFGPADGQETLLDGAQARYPADASAGSSIAKPSNVGENLAVLEGGEEFIVRTAAVPKPGDSLHLQFRNLKAAAYTLEIRSKGFAVAGLKAVLVDKYAGLETTVSLQDSSTRYAFAVGSEAGSSDPQRFVVVYSTASVGPAKPKINGFTAVLKEGVVQADWVVEDGETVQDCLLERSTGGGVFIENGRVPGSGATGRQVYQAVDARPGLQNAYRVQVRTRGGGVLYSPVVTVDLPVGGLWVYPNPVREGRVQLVWNGAVAGAYTIQLVNAVGQVVRQQVVEHGGGTARHVLSMQGLASGSYMVVVEGPDGGVEQRKVVVGR